MPAASAVGAVSITMDDTSGAGEGAAPPPAAPPPPEQPARTATGIATARPYAILLMSRTIRSSSLRARVLNASMIMRVFCRVYNSNSVSHPPEMCRFLAICGGVMILSMVILSKVFIGVRCGGLRHRHRHRHRHRAAPAGAARPRTGSYRVTGMAETDTQTTALAPKALVGEIERTRANLARTIDEITDRVSPSNVAHRTVDRARGRISQIDPLVGGAVALAAVSVTCYLVWRRLRKYCLLYTS